MTSETERLAQYLRQIAELRRRMVPASVPYAGLEDFLLKEGIFMTPPPHDPGIARGTPKECFKNASDFMLFARTEYRYAEGLFMSAKLPIAIHHAWVVDATGHALDPTLGWEPDTAFCGVIFEPRDLRRRLLKQGFYGLLDTGVGYSDIVMGEDVDFPYKNLPTLVSPELD